jgi:hypothetical protein
MYVLEEQESTQYPVEFNIYPSRQIKHRLEFD